MRKGELAEVKLLEQASSDWDKAQNIRKFCACMEERIIKTVDEENKGKYIKWIKWARDKADWLDPLIEMEDDLLGKSKSIFNLIDDTDFSIK